MERRLTRRAFLAGLALAAVGVALLGRPARADDPAEPTASPSPGELLPSYQSNFQPAARTSALALSLPPISSLTVRAKISTTNFTSLEHDEAQVTADGTFNLINAATGGSIVPGGAPAGEVYVITNNSGLLRVQRLGGSQLGAFTGPIRVQPVDHTRLVQVKSVTRGDYGYPRFRGYLEVKQGDTAGKVNIINVLESSWFADPLEKYLYGVVPVEMPVSYGAEALKAQAVAARTCAASRYNGSYVDVTDSTSTQVYYGYGAEQPESTQAVEATRGVVATYEGKVISALYSACCGGHTEDNENVYTGGTPVAYLRGVRCYDDGSWQDLSAEAAATAFWQSSPASFCDWFSGLYRWPPVYWTRADLEAIINRYLPDVPSKYRSQDFSPGSLGELRALEAVERGVSGKISRLRIHNRAGNYWDVFSDYWIRYVLRSTLGSSLQFSSNMVFTHSYGGDGTLLSITARGGGWGHGVGLCQRGAKGMAADEQAYTFVDILKHYYSGIALEGGPVPPSQPRPTAPANGALILTTTAVTLAWTGDAAEYEAELCNADTGVPVASRPWAATTNWYLGPLPAGRYKWRVRGRNAAGLSSYSSWQIVVSATQIYRSHLPLIHKSP